MYKVTKNKDNILVFTLLLFTIVFFGIECGLMSHCYASESEEEQDAPSLDTMKSLFKILELANQANQETAEEGKPLEETALIFDFDETLAHLALTEEIRRVLLGLDAGVNNNNNQEGGVDNAVDLVQKDLWVYFSREIVRVDKTAFETAAKNCSMSLKEFREERQLFEEEMDANGHCVYMPLEEGVKDLFTKLRSMGASLFVCSGLPYSKKKGEFLKEIGFCDEDTASVFIYKSSYKIPKKVTIWNILEGEEHKYSRVFIIDNNLKTIKGCIPTLHKYFLDEEGVDVPEITGIHYNRFHSSVTVSRILSQRQLLINWREKKKKLAPRALEINKKRKIEIIS